MSELYLNAEQQPPKKVLLLGLDLGKFDPDRSMEELSARSGLSTAALSAVLMKLELSRRVTCLPGKRYILR